MAVTIPAMQFSIDLIHILMALGGLLLGFFVGALLFRGKSQQAYQRAAELEEQAEAHGESQLQWHQQITELNAANARLEERLVQQKDQFETQIKLLQETKQSLTQEFENLANRIFDDKQNKFSSQSKEALENTLNPLRREIGDFRKKVEDAYDKENAERNRLVGQISELQKQTMQISSDAVALANALRGDSKAQGNWGEVVLERLLEESGLSKGREYETQVALKDDDGKRRNPDVVVHLPEGRDIVIDAKVSLTHYERYYHAEEEGERQANLNQHLASLRAHVKGLGSKDYENLEGVNSLDFVLLFVPIEAAFMLAVDNDPDLVRDAHDRNIIIASPSTLMVALRTIKNLWRYADQNRNAQLIADKAGALYDQFVLYTEALDDVGKHLDKSQQAWQTAHKRLASGRGNLVRRTEELKKLGAKTRKSIDQELSQQAEDSDSNITRLDLPGADGKEESS